MSLFETAIIANYTIKRERNHVASTTCVVHSQNIVLSRVLFSYKNGLLLRNPFIHSKSGHSEPISDDYNLLR